MGFYIFNNDNVGQGWVKSLALKDQILADNSSFTAFESDLLDDPVKLENNVLSVDSAAVLEIAEETYRSLRDKKLVEEVDALVSNPLRWADLTAAKQTEWTTYRTDLLGVPQQAGFPNAITWPTKP